MPLTDEKKNGLRALISKHPGMRDAILSRAKANGVSDEDISSVGTPTFPQHFRSAVGNIGKTIDTETDAMAEGIASGATWGMMPVPHNSDPYTVDLPFFGKTSPSRAAGTVLGAALSPLALPVAGVTGALTSRAAPAVGELGAQALGAVVTGGSLETIRQLAFDDEIDPAKIVMTAALFLAGDMAAEYAPSVVNQLAAWKSKIPKERLALVERFKELPEVQAEAATLQKTSPLFNPEYQEMLKKQKLAQDQSLGLKPLGEDRMLPAPPVPPTRIQEDPATIQAAMQAHIDRTINPQTPLLREHNILPGESPDVIAAAQTRAELQSPSRQIANTSSAPVAPQLPVSATQQAMDGMDSFIDAANLKQQAAARTAQRKGAIQASKQKAVESNQKIDEAMEKFYDLLGVSSKPKAKEFSGAPTRQDFPGSELPGGEPINLSNVLVGDVTRENAESILHNAKRLELEAKLALKKIEKNKKASTTKNK